MRNNQYWEKRVANETWDLYNDLEKKNKMLLEMYQEAKLDIEDEVMRILYKVNAGKPVTLSDMHKYNRLTKLKENITDIIKELGKKAEDFGKSQLEDAIIKEYKKVMETLDNIDFAMPNKKLMDMMLNNPWSGATFSERLWENTRVLANNLNEILTKGLVQGKSIESISKELDIRMMKGFNACHKLIRTETMHYLNESCKKAYKDSGCREVQIWAAIDERTCAHCGKEHSKAYKVDSAPILPFHPMCRCTYLPVINE